MSGSFRCLAIGSRLRSPKLRSPKDPQCSRRMADGSHIPATKEASWTFTYSLSPGQARNLKYRETVVAIRSGESDGKELFYLAADGTMMAVAIGAARSLDAGVPQALFHDKRVDTRA